MRTLILAVILSFVPASAQVTDKTNATESTKAPATSTNSALARRVTMLLTATDRGGLAVKDLSKDSISVIDNDHIGQVVDVRNANPLPMDVAIVLLASKNNFSQQQNAAVDLVRKVIRPGIDKAFVVTAGGEKPWPSSRLDWQSDPAELEKTIRGLEKNVGMSDAFGYNLTNEAVGNNRGMGLQTYNTGGFTVFDIVWKMLQTDPQVPRHVLVIFRNAWAHSPGFSDVYSKGVEANHNHVIAQAQHLWVPMYVIGVEEPMPGTNVLARSYTPMTSNGAGGAARAYDEEWDKERDRAYNAGRANLERMAAETGGGVWWGARKNYQDATNAIADLLQASYAVTYTVPADASASAEHVLQVKASNQTRIGVQKTYFSRQAPKPALPTQPQAQTVPSVTAN